MVNDFLSQPGSTSPELIAGVQRDDQQSWRTLVRIYSPLVYYWCRQQAELSADDAADVMQDVFLTVARGMPRFRRDDGGSFRGWLRTIVSSKVTDHFRRTARDPTAGHTVDVTRVPDAVPARELFDSAGKTAPNGQELAVLLYAVLEELRDQFSMQSWQAFWRTVIQEQPRDEIAQDLGISKAAVNQAAYRIRRRLREVLQNRPEFGG